MKLVQQEAFGECGLAVCAMVTERSLEQVRQDALDAGRDVTTEGLRDDDIVGYLKHHGLTEARATMWDVLPDEPAILTVPSLNHIGILHYVVWTGSELLDPSPGPKRYPEDCYRFPGYAPPLGCHWATAIVWHPKDHA